MGKNLYKMTGFRFTDEKLVPKLDVIAKANKRNRNQQMEWFLEQYIREYEAEHGKIELDEEA